MTVAINPTGWGKASDDTIVEYSATEGILITLDTHDPPDVNFGGVHSPFFSIGENFVVTGKLGTSGDGAYDIETTFYLYNMNQSDSPPTNWRWVQFDWYSYEGRSECTARSRPSGTATFTPNPIIDIEVTPWWRMRCASGTVYWEVSEDGVSFTTLGSAVWSGKSSDQAYIQLDCYGNAESGDDWWSDFKSAVINLRYLKVDDTVWFDNTSSVASSEDPNVFLRTSKGWLKLQTEEGG